MLLCNLVRVRTLRHAAPTRHYLKYGLIIRRITRLTTLCRYVMSVIWTFYCCVRHGMTRTRYVFADCMPTECVLLNVRDRASSITCRLITAESLLRSQITLVYNWWIQEVDRRATFEHISGRITSHHITSNVLCRPTYLSSWIAVHLQCVLRRAVRCISTPNSTRCTRDCRWWCKRSSWTHWRY